MPFFSLDSHGPPKKRSREHQYPERPCSVTHLKTSLKLSSRDFGHRFIDPSYDLQKGVDQFVLSNVKTWENVKVETDGNTSL